MAMAFILGPIKVFSKVIGSKTRSRASANTSGMMAAYMKAIGKIMICMDKACIDGLMADIIKVHLNKIKSTAMVFIHLPTKDAIKDNSKMAYSTEVASSLLPTEKNAPANGLKAKD